MSSYKNEQVHTTVSDAIDDAFAEFQALRDEMAENVSNMENAGTGLENTAKFQATQEAHDTLDQFADNQPDVPDAAEGLAVSVHLQVQKRKGRGTSRAVRYSNAVALLEAARDAVETAMDMSNTARRDAELRADEHESDAEEHRADWVAGLHSNESEEAEQSALNEAASARREAEEHDSDADALSTLFDEIDNVLGDASSEPEFPGMYG